MEAYFDFLTDLYFDEADVSNYDEGILTGTICEYSDQGWWFCETMDEDDRIRAEEAEQADMNHELFVKNGVLTHMYDDNIYITYEDEDVDYSVGIELVRSDEANDGVFIKVDDNVLDNILEGNGIIDLGANGVWNVFDLEFFGFDTTDDGDMVYYFESLEDTYYIDEIPFHHLQIDDELYAESPIDWIDNITIDRKTQILMVLMLVVVVFMPIIMILSRRRRRPRSLVDQRKPLLNVVVETIRKGESSQNHEGVQEDGSCVLHPSVVAKSVDIEETDQKEPYIVFI